MGGISAIFGLGRRQQEKVTAAALERGGTARTSDALPRSR